MSHACKKKKARKCTNTHIDPQEWLRSAEWCAERIPVLSHPLCVNAAVTGGPLAETCAYSERFYSEE